MHHPWIDNVALALTLALSQRERGYVLLLAATLLLTACGHRTALVRPQDIPEYERVRQQKIEKYDPYREEDDSWF